MTTVAHMSDNLGFDDFSSFAVINTTTQKLAAQLEELTFHNVLVVNGDTQDEGEGGYYHILDVVHTGGRDWTVICGIELPAIIG